MIKQWTTIILLLLALVACSSANANNGNQSPPSEPVATDSILMTTTEFVPNAVTIPAGSSLTLKAEGFVPHFIANGTWENGAAVAAREAGAPEINNIQIEGGKEGTIGPFTESGTFLVYCTIHQGMNLTVVVE